MNPWKGLVSYEEKDLDNYEFCGRTKAISKYYSLITNNLISTLYGRTGCGKTSILQAGIFPLLRQESYFPVMCRLSLRNKNVSFADYLIERVEQEIGDLGFSCMKSNVPINQVDDLEKYKLWQYFYGHEFYGKDDNVVFPVIVLDQFEEVLINSKDDSLKFLEQVSFLVGDDLLLPDDCYANFRVTISLREDFLYLLEDTIDERKLQGLRDNRMRLTPLSIEEAEEVISLGDEFIKDTDREQIYNSICKLADNRRGHISTNMLSLICSQLYQLYSKKQGKELVTIDDMKQLDEDPLREFYRNSVKGLQKETITFIENNLVLNGFRRPVTKREFEARVPAADRERLTTGETKILQFITANDNDCVELIHDTLARTVYGAAREKKRISKSNKLVFFSIETLFCIIASLAIVFDVIVNNYSCGVAIGGVLVVMTNWLYSLATFGNKSFSKIHLILLWLFNSIIFISAAGEGLLDNVSKVSIYFLLIYLGFIPIINLIRQSHSEVKLGFWKSFKYVFRCETIKEDDNRIPALSIALVIGVGILSGFFMSSWCLWILLPLASAICYYMIKHTIVKSASHDNAIPYILPALLSIGLVTVQHIAAYHVILTYLVLLLFLVWAVACAIQQKEMSLVRKITYSVSLFLICALTLPVLYLGYNPLAKDFRNNARNWIQPRQIKSESAIAIPLLAFHNEEGLNGLADRHQIIFDAKFMNIDSVSYEFFDSKTWETLKDKFKLDYGILSGYINDVRPYNSDIILYTKSGSFRWKDMFSDRGNSLYLTTRLDTLEKTSCTKWTEDEFSNIAELAAGYRITGSDSLANSLEVLYFLRRMIQAEIYQNVEADFRTNAETCEDILDYYLHKRVVSDFKGDYWTAFVENADSCVVLKGRINKYLDIADGGFTKECKKNLQSIRKNTDEYKSFTNRKIISPLMVLAKIDTVSLLSLLNSYKTTIIPIKWVREQLGNSVDMLYQTRNTWGNYVADSLFTAVYENDFFDDASYNISSAWHNLFLCRFADAEKYARKSIECAKEDYFTGGSTTKYITYTNLITSLFLQGKTTESIDLLRKMKDYSIGGNKGDWVQLLFPIQAIENNVSVGEGVCQDFNHFAKAGVLRDSTTTEYRELRKLLSLEYSLPSDQGHYVYPNGWNLSMIPDSLYLFYKDEHVRLPLIKSYDINIKDSIAICQMDAGGYRFLDLSKMQFIGETYNYAWHFSEGVAAVEKDGKIGFINRLGQLEIDTQYPTEDWLHKDHYRLAFHNGKAAVIDPMGSNAYYNLIDREGNWLWDGYSFPYVKLYGVGMVVGGDNMWVYTDSDEIKQGEFDSEMDDVLFNPYSKSYIPVFNHFDVSGIKHADDVPEFDISGIWYCDSEKSYVYFGKNDSQYMWLGKKHDSGNYYLSKDGENNIMAHMCSDKLISKGILIPDGISSDRIFLGDLLLIKLRSL